MVLFGHDHSTPPIAKATKIWVENNVLKARDEFMIGEEFGEHGKFAASILAMYKGGFMSAFSVGFIPQEYLWDDTRGGFNFAKQEMLEHSAVPVPSNPNALVQARSAGIDMGPLKGYIMGLLDSGIWAPKELESMYQQVKTHKSVQVAEQIEDTPDESTDDENKTPIEALAEDAEAEPVADEPSDESGEDVEAESAEEDGEPESDEKAPVEYTIKLDASELIAEMKSLGAKLEIWINEKDATPAPEPVPEPQALTDEERAEIVDKLSQSIKDKVRMQTTGALPD